MRVQLERELKSTLSGKLFQVLTMRSSRTLTRHLRQSLVTISRLSRHSSLSLQSADSCAHSTVVPQHVEQNHTLDRASNHLDTVSSSYRSNRLGLSHWDPYAVRRGGCLELSYCNMVEWFWCDSSLISTTNWFPSVLWHCWFGHLACKNRPRNDLLCVEWDVKPYTLTLT